MKQSDITETALGNLNGTIAFGYSLCCIILIFACSPIPLIQSPRVKSQFSISASASKSIHSMRPSTDKGNVTTKQFNHEEITPLFFTVGIKNRVELSWIFGPYFLTGYMWQGNAKVNLFEWGNEHGRNLASAIFIGSKGYFGEHEKITHNYSGISGGSVIHSKVGDFEFILQTSLADEKQKSFELQDRYRIFWLQPALGMSFLPSYLTFSNIQFTIGVNYSHALNSLVTYHNYTVQVPVSVRNNVTGGFAVTSEVKFIF